MFIDATMTFAPRIALPSAMLNTSTRTSAAAVGFTFATDAR